LAWIPSTRASASSMESVGHGAPVFTRDLPAFQSQSCELAAALPPVAGFPASEYYGGSAPTQGPPPTAGLPATGPAGRWKGQPRAGSHVPHVPVDGGGAQLFPGSLATSTPQSFLVAFWPDQLTGVGVALPSPQACVRCCPAHIHQVGAGSGLTGG
jgi:hypothetical protein